MVVCYGGRDAGRERDGFMKVSSMHALRLFFYVKMTYFIQPFLFSRSKP